MADDRRLLPMAMNVRHVFREPVFDTFEAAVQHTPGSPRTERARADNRRLRSQSVAAHHHGWDWVELLLTSGTILRLWVGTRAVEWEFLPGPSGAALTPSVPSRIELQFPDTHMFTWTPRALLDQRVGVPGIAVLPSPTLVTLAVRRLPELQFSELAQEDDRRILFFSEV